MRKRAMLVVATGLLALVAAGCGGKSTASGTQSAPAKTASPNAPEVSPAGDIPDNQAFVSYTPAGGSFSVKVPEGWAQTGSGAKTSFTDKLNSISIDTVAARAALTVNQAKQSVAGSTVDVVRRSAGPAVRIKFLADSKPDPVTGKVTKDAIERYVFFHNGQRLVLTLSGPKGADNVDPWKIVTDSVRWTR
ncbi:MAG: hypothetical protein QOJ29_4033 [Thermoleophilaceae bacterium]|nr:hypothetical protein [Thermoleophilaceae bacterium]